MARPTVNTSCIANKYANRHDERIIEFNDGTPGGAGGLISFKRLEDGSLSVSLYHLDEGVKVHVSEERSPR